MNHPPIDAILLAAGAGRRLGYPKAQLRIQGKWMLPRLVTAFHQGGIRKVILVLSETAREGIANLGTTQADLIVLNPCPEQGRNSSIRCGVEGLGLGTEQAPAGIMIHACDIPLLSSKVVKKVRKRWQKSDQPTRMLARPITPGGRGGHPLLVGADLYPELLALGSEHSLREIVHADPSRRLDVRITGDPGPFLDVDTTDQLQLLESLLKHQTPESGDASIE